VIADQQMVVSITASGYAKRTAARHIPPAAPRRRGVQGMNMKEGDYIEHLHVCSTHDYLLFFTNQGKGLPASRSTSCPRGHALHAAAPWLTSCRSRTRSG
jgi:DNA gyrase/topoisomerase IV subunit A